MYSASDITTYNSRDIKQQLVILSNQLAIFIDRYNLESVEIIQYDKISHKVWRNGPTIIQAKILRRIIRSETYGLDRVEPQFDSMAHHRVDMPACYQILRITII